MSDAERLRQLQAMAVRIAAATTNRETREMLLSIAEQYGAEAKALEPPPDEPPLPAS